LGDIEDNRRHQKIKSKLEEPFITGEQVRSREGQSKEDLVRNALEQTLAFERSLRTISIKKIITRASVTDKG
jgi:hypothetical protein